MYWHTFLICIWLLQESRFIKRSNKLARTWGTRHDVNGRANHFQILPHLWCQRNINLCFPRFMRVYLTRCSEIQQLLCCFTCFTSWRFEVQTLWGRPIPSGTPSWSRCLVFFVWFLRKKTGNVQSLWVKQCHTPSPISPFFRLYGCHSQSWVVYEIVFPPWPNILQKQDQFPRRKQVSGPIGTGAQGCLPVGKDHRKYPS